MRSKNYKGCKCIKKKVSKCEEVVRTYDAIQTAYVDVLDQDDSIRVIKCNVIFDDIENDEYTTDFYCEKSNGDFMVRECVFRKKLALAG